MRTFARAVLPALLLALALAPVADANMMYSYVGDTFKTVPGITGLISGVYTTQDRITGWLIVADGFTPAFGAWYQDLTPGVVHYSFTDGHQTLTEANSTAWFRLAVLNPADVAFCPLLRCWNVGVTTPGGG